MNKISRESWDDRTDKICIVPWRIWWSGRNYLTVSSVRHFLSIFNAILNIKLHCYNQKRQMVVQFLQANSNFPRDKSWIVYLYILSCKIVQYWLLFTPKANKPSLSLAKTPKCEMRADASSYFCQRLQMFTLGHEKNRKLFASFQLTWYINSQRRRRRHATNSCLWSSKTAHFYTLECERKLCFAWSLKLLDVRRFHGH